MDNLTHILKCHGIFKTDFVRGDGCYLFDSEGKRYVDFESGIWSSVIGHSHPRITHVISNQAEKLIHLGTRYPNSIAEDAAIDVLNVVGVDEGKCTFLSSGSEAVEFAVQTARLITNRQKLVTFARSYLAAYGSAGIKRPDEWLVLDWNDCADTGPDEYLKRIPFESIGAFVFEPGGSGSGFVNFPPGRLVKDIARHVQRAGGLVVVNEVTTGMGRTGKWFGFQHYDIQPDIVALGKGLGNGYPVSAVAMKRTCAEKIENSGFHYVQSHQNDPLGCSIAREVISILKEGDWIERGNEAGTYFLEGLIRLQEKRAIVTDVRGRGMLLALELGTHESISVSRVYSALLENRFLIGYYPAGNILRFDPSLTIEEDDIHQLLESLASILKAPGEPS